MLENPVVLFLGAGAAAALLGGLIRFLSGN